MLGSANNLKALLVDYLIKEQLIRDCLFGSELFYGTKKRQADFLAVNGSITAFEIKSSSDNFRKLREQLDDYKLVFDYQYLVTTEHQLKGVRGLLKPNEGLIVVDESLNFKIKRKPRKILKQNKIEILETMPLVFLKQYFKLNSLKKASDVRRELETYPLKKLKEALKVFLKERLITRNELFLSERGEVTHFEDIKLLTTAIESKILGV